MTAQRRPKRLQDSPRGAQDSPGGAHDGPRGAQDGPEGAQDSPRGAQKAPKRLPKRPRDPPGEPPRGPPGPSQNDLGTRPLKITKIIEKPMVFQHFWAPDPTPHRPPNRVLFQPPGQKEKKQKKELSFGQTATSIGLRPLSVNRDSSGFRPTCLPPAASRTFKKPEKM